VFTDNTVLVYSVDRQQRLDISKEFLVVV